MSTAGAKITPGSTVCMHFSLALRDGTEFVSTFGEDPLRFTMGDGTLTAGLELALYGLRAGAEQSLRIDGDLAYGPRDESNIHWVPLEQFPADIQSHPGLVVAFTTPQGDEVAGTILEQTAARARVDFNHPLSGREVLFRVQILSVDPPPDAEGQ